MPGLPVGAIVQFRVNGLLQFQQTISSFWYQVATAGTAPTVITDLDDLLTKFATSVTAPYVKYLLCLPSSWSGVRIDAQQITPVRSVARDTDISGAVGARGATESSNLSAVIDKGTDLAGRSQMGSLHLPGVATADQTGGLLENALLTAMSTLGSVMLTNLSGDTYDTLLRPIIPHVKKPMTTTTGDIMTRTIPQRQIRVMRRRTVGVGK